MVLEDCVVIRLKSLPMEGSMWVAGVIPCAYVNYELWGCVNAPQGTQITGSLLLINHTRSCHLELCFNWTFQDSADPVDTLVIRTSRRSHASAVAVRRVLFALCGWYTRTVLKLSIHCWNSVHLHYILLPWKKVKHFCDLKTKQISTLEWTFPVRVWALLAQLLTEPLKHNHMKCSTARIIYEFDLFTWALPLAVPHTIAHCRLYLGSNGPPPMAASEASSAKTKGRKNLQVAESAWRRDVTSNPRT